MRRSNRDAAYKYNGARFFAFFFLSSVSPASELPFPLLADFLAFSDKDVRSLKVGFPKILLRMLGFDLMIVYWFELSNTGSEFVIFLVIFFSR